MNDQLLRPDRCRSVACRLHASHLALSFAHSRLAAFHCLVVQFWTLVVIDGSAGFGAGVCACAARAKLAAKMAAPMARRMRGMARCSWFARADRPRAGLGSCREHGEVRLSS